MGVITVSWKFGMAGLVGLYTLRWKLASFLQAAVCRWDAELLWSRRDCLRARATSYSHPTLDHSLFRHSLHKIPGSGQHTHSVCWTLSHRWGDPEKVFQLRHSTESSFRNGIALEQLSLTFRDAAPLVHGLGFQHIWIDSLCIFQDSLADSQCEASTMADVYRHSSCKSPPRTHHTTRPPLTLVYFAREEPTPDCFIRSKQALGKENARRKARQQRRRNQHQERLKHHKRRLVLHNMVAPAASHLGNAVNAPNENGCVRPHHHIRKHPEIAVPPERYALRPLRRRAISSHGRGTHHRKCQISREQQASRIGPRGELTGQLKSAASGNGEQARPFPLPPMTRVTSMHKPKPAAKNALSASFG